MAETVTPMPGVVLIEPEDMATTIGLRQRFEAAGLAMPEPKHQGVPNVGRVYAVPPGEVEISVGMKVVFNEPNPSGFKWGGHKLLPIAREKVLAGVAE